jgi:hypothetical protein
VSIFPVPSEWPFLFCVLCLGRLDEESRRADSNR